MTPEWIVIRMDPTFPSGYERFQTDGKTGHAAPVILDLEKATRSRDLLNRLEDGKDRVPHGDNYWRLVHYVTLTPPPQHQQWVNQGGKVTICEHCGKPTRPIS